MKKTVCNMICSCWCMRENYPFRTARAKTSCAVTSDLWCDSSTAHVCTAHVCNLGCSLGHPRKEKYSQVPSPEPRSWYKPHSVVKYKSFTVCVCDSFAGGREPQKVCRKRGWGCSCSLRGCVGFQRVSSAVRDTQNERSNRYVAVYSCKQIA